jgi:hypothetical protein
MVLASGDDARARGVHRVGVEVFNSCPNVFSFRRFPRPMCSLFGPMCSVEVDDASARAAKARRRQCGFGVEIRRGLRAEAVGDGFGVGQHRISPGGGYPPPAPRQCIAVMPPTPAASSGATGNPDSPRATAPAYKVDPMTRPRYAGRHHERPPLASAQSHTGCTSVRGTREPLARRKRQPSAGLHPVELRSPRNQAQLRHTQRRFSRGMA